MADKGHDVAYIRLPAPIPLLTNNLGHYIHHIFLILAAIFMRPIQFTPAFLSVAKIIQKPKIKKSYPLTVMLSDRQLASLVVDPSLVQW
jgi:hypothetical protein